MGNGMNYEESEKYLDTYYQMGGNVSLLQKFSPVQVLMASLSTLPTTTKVSTLAKVVKD